MSHALPASIGPYRVTGLIGAGGMGQVYAALDGQGRGLAIKVLLGSSQATPAQRARFTREIQALRQIEHPNVVSVLDAGEQGGVLWFAMPALPGESLEARLRRQPLTPAAVLDLGDQLCAAFELLHSRGILHRDLKPDNVFCAAEGRYVLLDFGLVKDLASAESVRLSLSGALQGTPGYWAPEQASGKGAQADARTDVYGLGALLYAALTGLPPCRGSSLVEVLAATLSTPPEPPSEQVQDVPPALERAILWALAKEPERRPASAAALGEALRAESLDDDSAPSRRPLGLWVSAVGALVSLLALGGVLSLRSRPKDALEASSPSPRRAGAARPSATNPGATPLEPAPAPELPSSVPDLRRAIAEGRPGARVALAERLLAAPPSPDSTQEALRLLRGAVASGEDSARLPLGLALIQALDPEGRRHDLRVHAEDSRTEVRVQILTSPAPTSPASSALQEVRQEALAGLHFGARGGRPEAMLELGIALADWKDADPPGEGGIDWIARAAEAGIARAALRLGLRALSPRRSPAERPADLVWLAKAAEAGEHEAALALGALLLQEGVGVAQRDEAVGWLRRAASAGHLATATFLGDLLLTGRRVPAAPEEAIRVLRGAAAGGAPAARVRLGEFLVNAPAPLRNVREGLDWLRRAAEAGDLSGMVAFGSTLATWSGLEQTPGEGARWLERAAETGDPKGQGFLASHLSRGLGMARDLPRAVVLARAAAEAGDPEGMQTLGILLTYGGPGLDKDLPAGATWFRKAAEAEHVGAAHNYALALLYARGVPQDLTKGTEWLRRAAEWGHPVACDNLGHAYRDGRGVHKDLEEALRWFRLGAERGHTNSMANIAEIYQAGDAPITRDYREAERWWRRCVAHGNGWGQVGLASMILEGQAQALDPGEVQRLLDLAEKSPDSRLVPEVAKVRKRAAELAASRPPPGGE